MIEYSPFKHFLGGHNDESIDNKYQDVAVGIGSKEIEIVITKVKKL